MQRPNLWCLAPTLLGAILASPASAHTLQGRVLDSTSLAPVAYATVNVHALDPDSLHFIASADENGNYTVTGIAPGNSIYIVIGERLGYQASYARVDQLATGDVTYDILLGVPDPPPPPGEPPPDSGSVSGQVMAAGEGGTLHAVAGATVTLQSSAGTTVAIADVNGAYEAWVGLGTYSVGVTAAGYEPLAGAGLAVGPGGVRFDAVLDPASTAGVPDAGSARAWFGPVAPHPVRGVSTLFYTLAAPGQVELALYDAAGRRSRTLVYAWEDAGPHAVAIRAQGLPSGAYFCRLRVGGAFASRTLVIVR